MEDLKDLQRSGNGLPLRECLGSPFNIMWDLKDTLYKGHLVIIRL